MSNRLAAGCVASAIVLALVSVLKPEVGHLVARAVLVAAVMAAIAAALLTALKALPAEPTVRRRRWRPKAKAAPRQVNATADELRRQSSFRRATMPYAVANRLADLFQSKLEYRFGITPAKLSESQLAGVLSPAAARLVLARHAYRHGVNPLDNVPLAALEPLLKELETL